MSKKDFNIHDWRFNKLFVEGLEEGEDTPMHEEEAEEIEAEEIEEIEGEEGEEVTSLEDEEEDAESRVPYNRLYRLLSKGVGKSFTDLYPTEDYFFDVVSNIFIK